MASSSDALAPEVEAVVAACMEVLRQTPSAVVTDIDGTISAIAPTPAEAMVDPGAKAALALLAERLAAVAVVSGRAPQDGAAMVGLPELTYVGNHGLERIARGTPWTHPVAAAAQPAIAAALAEIESAARAAADVPWLLVENKGVTGTIHYRLAPDQIAAAALLEPLARAAADPARSAPHARPHDLRSASRSGRQQGDRHPRAGRRISVCAASSSSATTSPTSTPSARCASCGRQGRRQRCVSACSARRHHRPCWLRST